MKPMKVWKFVITIFRFVNWLLVEKEVSLIFVKDAVGQTSATRNFVHTQMVSL